MARSRFLRFGLVFAAVGAAAVCALVPGLAGQARAQDARNAPPADPRDDTPPPARVYVPFDDLKKVFGAEGQGVFVPYKEFQELWKKAMDRGPDAAPVSGVSSALYEGRVEGDLALLDAKLEVQSGADGETAIPVGLSNATIGSAMLDGKPAVLLSDKKGRRVVVRGKGAHKLDVTLVAAVLPKDGDRTVAFPSAGAPVSRLAFTVPGEGVRVTVEPNLATTRTEGGSGTTQVMAYVGAAPEIRLTWRPKPVETAGTAAILQSQTEVLHRVGEQTVETRLFARFTILRAGMKTFRARYPATERLLQVEGSGIRSWEETDAAGEREVRVDLHNDAEGTYDLKLQFERPRTAADTTAELPTISFPGASRDAGTIAVQVLPPIAVRPAAVEGLYRVPTDDLAAWMKTGFAPLAPGVTVLAWRYAGGTRKASVSVETVAPEVTAGERSVLEITTAAATMRAAFDLDVQRAGVFQAAVSVPDGWDLESAQLVEGNALRAIDARVEGAGATRRILLDLGARRMGAVPVVLSLRRPLTLGATDSPLDVPVLAVDGAVRSRGVVAVAADEALDVRTGTVSGFVAAEPLVLRNAGVPLSPPSPGQSRVLLFGFRHAGETRAATLQMVRRKPLVVAETVTLAGVEMDRLHVQHVLRWSVRYAGVDTFRFSLPKAVADRVRVEGAAVKERSKAADPADAERVIHTVVLQAPALGDTTLTAEYDLPMEQLAVGGTRKLDVPALAVVGAERDQGWMQVSRDPALSVEGDAKGMIYADVREIPDWARAQNAFLAWRRLSQPHGLTLSVARHEAVPILQAVVNAMALDTLVGGGAVSLTEARMDVQVNGLQYLRVELPQNAQIESTEVDGRPVSPRVENGVLLLPCPPGKSRDDRFGVRVVYREAADAAGRWFSVGLTAPKVPDAMLQAAAWTAWVPADCTHFAGSGNMRTSESRSVLDKILDAAGNSFAGGTMPGRPTTRGGALPPNVTLNVDMRRSFSFHRTGEDARLEASFLPRVAAGAIAALAALGLVAAAMFLARRGIPATRTALVAAAGALALFPLAAPGLRTTCAWMIAASVVLVVLSWIRAAWSDAHGTGRCASEAPASPSTPPADTPANPADSGSGEVKP